MTKLKADLQKFPAAIAPIERVDPEDAAKLGLIGKLLPDADRCEPVEDSEFLFAKALIDDQRI